jgi:hypothetical protein
MTSRRGGRPSQVRPRPPSTGHPSPAKPRAKAPASTRVRSSTTAARRGLPIGLRFTLGVAVVAFGAVVLLVATGVVGRLAGGVGSAVGGLFEGILATPTPSAEPTLVADPPTLTAPTEPYTNVPTVDLVGRVPADVVGRSDQVIRLYVAVGNGEPGPFKEVPVGSTPDFVVPGIALTDGTNTFSATIVGPAGESDPSADVVYVLDTVPPPIAVKAPTEGATVNATSAEVRGTTQARSKLELANATTGTSVLGEAAIDGSFALAIDLAPGPNELTVRVTDPAGNAAEQKLHVVRGDGVLSAALSTSATRIRASKLPVTIRLSVSVKDPDGHPLRDAAVTFSLTIAGVPPVTSGNVKTNGAGVAEFPTTIPAGATVGQGGMATVLVNTSTFGQATDRRALTVVE